MVLIIAAAVLANGLLLYFKDRLYCHHSALFDTAGAKHKKAGTTASLFFFLLFTVRKATPGVKKRNGTNSKLNNRPVLWLSSTRQSLLKHAKLHLPNHIHHFFFLSISLSLLLLRLLFFVIIHSHFIRNQRIQVARKQKGSAPILMMERNPAEVLGCFSSSDSLLHDEEVEEREKQKKNLLGFLLHQQLPCVLLFGQVLDVTCHQHEARDRRAEYKNLHIFFFFFFLLLFFFSFEESWRCLVMQLSHDSQVNMLRLLLPPLRSRVYYNEVISRALKSLFRDLHLPDRRKTLYRLSACCWPGFLLLSFWNDGPSRTHFLSISLFSRSFTTGRHFEDIFTMLPWTDGRGELKIVRNRLIWHQPQLIISY